MLFHAWGSLGSAYWRLGGVPGAYRAAPWATVHPHQHGEKKKNPNTGNGVLFQDPMQVFGWKMQASVLTNNIFHKKSLYRPPEVKNLTSPCCTTVQHGGVAPCTNVQLQCSMQVRADYVHVRKTR